MSMLTQTIAIPVWLLILVGVTMLLLFLSILKRIFRNRQARIISQKSDKNNTVRSRDNKADISKVLQLLASEGDRGMLMRSITDRLGMSGASIQQAMKKLIESKMVDEVVGVSGTKHYLTQLGKSYCSRKIT